MALRSASKTHYLMECQQPNMDFQNLKLDKVKIGGIVCGSGFALYGQHSENAGHEVEPSRPKLLAPSVLRWSSTRITA